MSVPLKCLLDMDGVIADFVKQICLRHNKPNPFETLRGPQYWDMAPFMGLSAEEFWTPCNSEEFWASIDPTPEFTRIVELLESYFGRDNIAILSMPSNHPGSVSGKFKWIERHMPAYVRRYLFGPMKHFCASDRTVLIDDNQENVKSFQAHGGRAYLVPRPWNDNWPHESRLLEDMSEYLDCLARPI